MVAACLSCQRAYCALFRQIDINVGVGGKGMFSKPRQEPVFLKPDPTDLGDAMQIRFDLNGQRDPTADDLVQHRRKTSLLDAVPMMAGKPERILCLWGNSMMRLFSRECIHGTSLVPVI